MCLDYTMPECSRQRCNSNTVNHLDPLIYSLTISCPRGSFTTLVPFWQRICMKKERMRAPEGQSQRNRPSRGYIYLVKNPSSNETSICAWDSVLYPGTSVVAPTRYGLDLGIIVA